MSCGLLVVKITINGAHNCHRISAHNCHRIKIGFSLLEDDKDMLEDLIVEAFSDAASRITETKKGKDGHCFQLDTVFS